MDTSKMNADEITFVKKHIEDLWQEDGSIPVMKKYIGIHYPATMCNLKCPYCYVGQISDFHEQERLNHEPTFIRWCLSQKRIGGRALIGICGAGETLLGDKIIDVCLELLREGHYLHIVTNGTVAEKMEDLCKKAKELSAHIFFKCSLHYLELKKKNYLSRYAKSIKKISDMGASYTIEMTADDSYIDVIDEIKVFCLEEFGALPHITIARDDSKEERPIMSSLSMSEYYDVWKQFGSELFALKWNYYGKHINNCDAGCNSLYINLLNGDIMKCLGEPVVSNLYDLSIEQFNFSRVGDECSLPYCYNNHAYLALGLSSSIKTYSYAQVRDRVQRNGEHWVKEEFYNFINQKIYENKE